MNIEYTTSNNKPSIALAKQIKKHLNKGETILWLLSGGSAIELAVKARSMIGDITSGTLHIGLVDERFGNIGHQDSNWEQLKNAGFDFTNVYTHPVITSSNIKECSNNYGDDLNNMLKTVNYSIGLYGIGPDGHTSGILPHSSAVNSKNLVHSYIGPDYQRITTTAVLVPLLDKIYVYAVGKNKWPAIEKMFDNIDISETPATIINKAKLATVYTDYKEV